MTGNIIVSTCCLGDMAVNAPEDSGAFTAISPSQTCANSVLRITCAEDALKRACKKF